MTKTFSGDVAAATSESAEASLVVLAGSGTGDLAGMTGSAEITRHEDGSHTFDLDYDLP